MSLDERRWLDLADSISRGESIDWKGQSTRPLTAEERRLLADLEILSGIASFHRQEVEPPPVVSPDEPLESGAPWGPLEIVRRIGSGSFGAVYLARDPRLDREVALKLLPERREAHGPEGNQTPIPVVVEEARRLARVRHPNVATIHGAERVGGRTGLWMEFIHGATLEEALAQGGPFAPEEAAVVGVHLCRALAAIHGEGLVHRDVKLGNVMREKGGRIVLLDFGLARESVPDAGAGPLSGTPLYLAPEVLAGGEASARSDLYGLGVALYRLVTGRYPIEARTFDELLELHARGAIRPARDPRPDLPEAFARILERALAKDPAARFATAGEMERALLAAIDAAPIPAVPAVPAAAAGFRVESSGTGPTTPASRAGRWIAIAAGAAIVVTGALALGFLLSKARATYHVQAAFHREGPYGDETLLSGSRVAPGDALSLEIDLSRRAFVYVVNEDDRGEAFLLFPLKGYELSNPLEPGPHRLPGPRAGREARWQVTSAGGREHFLIVASPQPLLALEDAARSLPAAQAGRPVLAAPLDEPTVQRLRGTGGVIDAGAPRPPADSAPGGGRLAALARQLGPDTEEVRGVWARAVDFENP